MADHPRCGRPGRISCGPICRACSPSRLTRESGRTGPSPSASPAGPRRCSAPGPPAVRHRLLDGQHRVEHVIGQLAGGPFRHTGPDRPGHSSTPSARCGMSLGHQFSDSLPEQMHPASARRNHSDPGGRRCPACPVTSRVVRRTADRSSARAGPTAAANSTQRGDRGRHGHRELRARPRPGPDHPGHPRPAAGRGDPADRARAVAPARSGSTGPCRAAARRRAGTGTPATVPPLRPGDWNSASAVCGPPIRPVSIARRAVCSPGAQHGVGALPPAAPVPAPGRAACGRTGGPAPSGFSVHTCLPASSAASPTSTCAAGMVRLTTISTSGSASSSTAVPECGTPCSAACAAARSRSRSATITTRRSGKEVRFVR